jgi:hypothetical protein
MRLGWGIFFVFLGGITVLVSLFAPLEKWISWVVNPIAEQILWSMGWSSAAIGAWLINTRDWSGSRDRFFSHYFWWFFVFCLTADTVVSCFLGISVARFPVKFRLASAVAALIFGFGENPFHYIGRIMGLFGHLKS